MHLAHFLSAAIVKNSTSAIQTSAAVEMTITSRQAKSATASMISPKDSDERGHIQVTEPLEDTDFSGKLR
jgi:hypothetical protein